MRIQTLPVGVLRFEAGVYALFVKRMRLRPNDVAANGDLLETAAGRPLLNRLDETPPHAACPPPFGHNQSANLANAPDHEKFVLHALNPPNDFPIRFRNKNDVFFPPARLFEAALHGFAMDRITENAAECRHPGRILGYGSANNEIIHGDTRYLLIK